jgi:hypothetical protein
MSSDPSGADEAEHRRGAHVQLEDGQGLRHSHRPRVGQGDGAVDLRLRATGGSTGFDGTGILRVDRLGDELDDDAAIADRARMPGSAPTPTIATSTAA